jgi:hypothetical protein
MVEFLWQNHSYTELCCYNQGATALISAMLGAITFHRNAAALTPSNYSLWNHSTKIAVRCT